MSEKSGSSRGLSAGVVATIVVACIGAIGTVTVAYFQFIAKPIIEMEATQTAEALKATQMADASRGAFLTAPPSPVFQPTTPPPPVFQPTTPPLPDVGTVSGHVSFYGTQKGIANITVSLISLDVPYQGLTNGNGDFIIQNIKQGKYELHASAIGYEETIQPTLIDVFPGQSTTTAEIIMIPAPMKSGSSFSLPAGQCFDFETGSINCGSSNDFGTKVTDAGLFIEANTNSNPNGPGYPDQQNQMTFQGCYDARKSVWPNAVQWGSKLVCFTTGDGNLAAIQVVSYSVSNDLIFNWELWSLR